MKGRYACMAPPSFGLSACITRGAKIQGWTGQSSGLTILLKGDVDRWTEEIAFQCSQSINVDKSQFCTNRNNLKDSPVPMIVLWSSVLTLLLLASCSHRSTGTDCVRDKRYWGWKRKFAWSCWYVTFILFILYVYCTNKGGQTIEKEMQKETEGRDRWSPSVLDEVSGCRLVWNDGWWGYAIYVKALDCTLMGEPWTIESCDSIKNAPIDTGPCTDLHCHHNTTQTLLLTGVKG